MIETTPRELLGPLNDVEEKNAPVVLFLQGDRSLLEPGPRVSIVGTRKPSPAGIRRAGSYARELGTAGVVIVSGLAEGVDAAAHRGAISAGARTVAVLGTPLGSYYPAANRALQDEIGREHLLVSQFRPGGAIQRKNFPIRNRTMALLTQATIIVEAGEGSGTIHQGWEALRLGRLLFIDSSVGKSEELKWPAEMMRYGAQVISPEDVDKLLEELPIGALAGGYGF